LELGTKNYFKNFKTPEIEHCPKAASLRSEEPFIGGGSN